MDKLFILWRYYGNEGWMPGYRTNSLMAAIIAYLDGKVRGEVIYLMLNLGKLL